MTVAVKICGLTSPTAVAAAAEAGADYAGFMFYPPSRRNVTSDLAAKLARLMPGTMQSVAVTVDADDDLLAEITRTMAPDLLQLHGDEPPSRVAEIKERFNRPVMKAVLVAGPDDIERARAYEDTADLLLFDAKPPTSMRDALPGGNGLVFDWQLIAGYRSDTPWMLSGGLTSENVAEAVRITGAKMVDVSSGVEDTPGQKNPDLITAFVRAAKEADQPETRIKQR